ncbi:hypothetical protein HPP92_027182 [Vanilla planifolia]|uniref:Uncharacterized protein n=1 Tax=Vanilla planifolia TaxID=51239 RepID=A0A835PA28_VANPL|nr:hypothetical protein HPP92_027182 [Vanilla planifolia]
MSSMPQKSSKAKMEPTFYGLGCTSRRMMHYKKWEISSHHGSHGLNYNEGLRLEARMERIKARLERIKARMERAKRIGSTRIGLLEDDQNSVNRERGQEK